MADNLKKYLGIPSFVVTVASGVLLMISLQASQKYNQFLTTHPAQAPLLRQVDSLDKARAAYSLAQENLTSSVHTNTIIKSMPGSKGTIDSYPDTEIIQHFPDVDNALVYLQKARNQIESPVFQDSDFAKTLDEKTCSLYARLDDATRGQSEESYDPCSKEILGLEYLASADQDLVNKQIPSEIIAQRESLKDLQRNTFDPGVIFGIIGVLGLVAYGINRVRERYS